MSCLTTRWYSACSKVSDRAAQVFKMDIPAIIRDILAEQETGGQIGQASVYRGTSSAPLSVYSFTAVQYPEGFS